MALLLSLLCAQNADGLGLETPKDWTRKDDPQKRFVQFVPPNIPAGGDCTVIVYPPAEYAGSTDQILDAMLGGMTQGKRALAAPQRLDIGSYRVGVVSQQPAQGPPEYLALHVTKFGNRVQAVLFAANDAAFFKARTPEVLAMLNKAVVPAAAPVVPAGTPPPPPTPAAAGTVMDFPGMTLTFPAGWTRKDDGSGWSILTPPQTPFPDPARVWVGPSKKFEGSLWVEHRALMKSLIEQAKWPGSYTDSMTYTAGPFIRSTSHCSADSRAITLYTAAAGGQMEVVIINPGSSEAMNAALSPILTTVRLKNATGDVPKRPEIVEAYRRPTMKKFINLNGTVSYGSLKYETLMLLSNGVADFTTTYGEGYDGWPGYALIDAGTLNGFYGKWAGEGRELQITRWADKPAEVWTRENGTLKFGDQTWTPTPRVDGITLKGRYAYKSEPGPGIQFDYWAEFSEDGKFKCADLLSWFSVSDFTGRAKPPQNVSGTYEIRNWTIWFKVDGKAVWSTEFSLLGDDPKDLSTILLNTYSFKRQ